MAANSRVASATQILCVMAYRGRPVTSGFIAGSLQTNAVVVLRLLKSLERAGLVELRPGRDGGVQLARPADQITLGQVFAAVEDDADVFALRQGGNPNCPVNRAMPALLSPIFSAASGAVAATLGATTIGALVGQIG